jgi:hypothetical protein
MARRYNDKCSGDHTSKGNDDDEVIVVRKKNGDTITMRRAKDDRSW